MSDLVRRLREAADDADMDSVWVIPILREAADALERRWIPVGEGLPDVNGDGFVEVLAWDGKDVWLATVNSFALWSCKPAPEEPDHGFYLDTPSDTGITHWMPLPPPPAKRD